MSFWLFSLRIDIHLQRFVTLLLISLLLEVRFWIEVVLNWKHDIWEEMYGIYTLFATLWSLYWTSSLPQTLWADFSLIISNLVMNVLWNSYTHYYWKQITATAAFFVFSSSNFSHLFHGSWCGLCKTSLVLELFNISWYQYAIPMCWWFLAFKFNKALCYSLWQVWSPKWFLMFSSERMWKGQISWGNWIC